MPLPHRLTLRSNATAAFVSVESAAVVGGFSDGAMMMLPMTEREITFVAIEPFDLATFMGGLTVRTLRDTY